MTLIGIAVIALVAAVGRRVAGRRVGIVAAAIAAFYPNIWMSDALIMSETLTLALVCLAILAALRYRERLDVRSAVIAGLVVGVAGHARSEVLIFPPLFALIGVRAVPWQRWARSAAALIGATLLVMVPWSAYNLGRYENPVLMSTNDGTTLLGANCPATYSGPAMGGWILTCLDDDLGKTDEDASQRSARQRRQAAAYARDNIERLPLVAGARVLRALDLYGLDDLVRGDVGEERARWSIWAGIVCWWVLAPMAAVGLWRNRRRYGIALLAPVVCVAVTTVVFYGSHRLRAPLEPLVAVGAALFLTGLPWVRDAITRRLGTLARALRSG
jgi:4-amino-4-deoxy-L-arabinose transferase-like glycosyltransferase